MKTDGEPTPPPRTAKSGDSHVRPTPSDVLGELDEIGVRGEEDAAALDPELKGAVAFTHFDSSSSHDNQLTILLARDDLPRLGSQTLVRVRSKADSRSYLGVVVKGPFSEPDAVPPNSTMAVNTVVQGKRVQYTFDYHGRAEVEILGEEAGTALVPPRYRPRPKSPVFLVDEAESARILGLKGDLCMGRVVGYESTEARIESLDKSNLPRHTGIIGTTGGGKSTTVASFVHRCQASGIATIIFDVEGEYTHLDEPTDQPSMLEALKRRGMAPAGVTDLHVHYLHGRDSTNASHRNRHPFALQFSSLSPFAIAEILDLPEAQAERFMKAYDVTKQLLRDFGIYPAPGSPDEERESIELDELTRGYPRMTIEQLLDVVSAFLYMLEHEKDSDSKRPPAPPKRRAKGTSATDLIEGADEILDEPEPTSPKDELVGRMRSQFRSDVNKALRRVAAQKTSHPLSWLGLASKLHRLRRLNIFDVKGARGVDYTSMLQPGRVSVIDLSDTNSPQLNNLVIADILRGLQEHQEDRYIAATKSGRSVSPVLIVIEEAHEFLSASRIAKMPVLFEQVARIAKRGRKRWLGLVFVTQLPQHLPNEVLGLINNFVIHKITDATVISRMQRSIGSIDEGLWNRVPRLAPGQALVSFSSFTRPLMVAIDPAPCKRLLVE